MPRITVGVDGVTYEEEVEPRLLLVHLLRDRLGKTGTPIGCDTGNCGACTVMLDGRSAKSCCVLAVQADGSEVVTIEGLARGQEWHPMQTAFHTEHGLQCGYCTPGMIMAAIDLVRDDPDPSEEAVREGLEGNLCRCTGYATIVRAVRRGAREMARGETGARTPPETGPPPETEAQSGAGAQTGAGARNGAEARTP